MTTSYMTALEQAKAAWGGTAGCIRGDKRVEVRAAELAAESDELLSEAMKVLAQAKVRAEHTARMGRNPLE